MTPWRFILLVALAFGSVLPHCDATPPEAMSASHHAGMSHDAPQPPEVQVSDACIGCAAPIRLAYAPRIAPTAAGARYAASPVTLATRDTALDPPPPRQAA